MNGRLLVAVGTFLLMVGAALPLAAVVKRGSPWGYRGHRGVFLEAAGDTQLNDAEGGRKDALPGVWLELGDEVRAGRFSYARGKLPEGGFAVSDNGVVKLTQKGLLFSSGALDVTVPAGPGRVVIEVEGFDAAMTARPGGSNAVVRVLADGRGLAQAYVRAGSLEAADRNVETGQVLTLQRGQTPKTGPAPAKVELVASCVGSKLTVTTGAGVQVFTPGSARISDGTPLVLDVATGATEVVVTARDVAGNVSAPSTVPCAKAAPTRGGAPRP